MQLYILDKDPEKAGNLLPDKYKFKMLIELAQMLSTVTGCGTYKPIKQGKEVQEWIKQHPKWVYEYFCNLFEWCKENINMKFGTTTRLYQIFFTFSKIYVGLKKLDAPKEAVFRYSSKYKCDYPSNSLLPIDVCVDEYNKYLMWKLR